MTEEHFRSIRRIVCRGCGEEVGALPSPWILSLGAERRAQLTDKEIGAEFHPAPHTLQGTNMRCVDSLVEQ